MVKDDKENIASESDEECEKLQSTAPDKKLQLAANKFSLKKSKSSQTASDNVKADSPSEEQFFSAQSSLSSSVSDERSFEGEAQVLTVNIQENSKSKSLWAEDAMGTTKHGHYPRSLPLNATFKVQFN